MTELTLQHGGTGTSLCHPPTRWHRLCAPWRRWLDRQAEASRRRRELRALGALSDATLRDLGLARCELESIQAEIDGHEAATRMRVYRHESGC